MHNKLQYDTKCLLVYDSNLKVCKCCMCDLHYTCFWIQLSLSALLVTINRVFRILSSTE